MQCNAMQCNAMQCNALYCSVPYRTTLCTMGMGMKQIMLRRCINGHWTVSRTKWKCYKHLLNTKWYATSYDVSYRPVVRVTLTYTLLSSVGFQFWRIQRNEVYLQTSKWISFICFHFTIHNNGEERVTVLGDEMRLNFKMPVDWYHIKLKVESSAAYCTAASCHEVLIGKKLSHPCNCQHCLEHS